MPPGALIEMLWGNRIGRGVLWNGNRIGQVLRLSADPAAREYFALLGDGYATIAPNWKSPGREITTFSGHAQDYFQKLAAPGDIQLAAKTLDLAIAELTRPGNKVSEQLIVESSLENPDLGYFLQCYETALLVEAATNSQNSVTSQNTFAHELGRLTVQLIYPNG